MSRKCISLSENRQFNLPELNIEDNQDAFWNKEADKRRVADQ